MPAPKLCPECGALLADDDPGTYCAGCLIKHVLDEGPPQAGPVDSVRTMSVPSENAGDRIGPYKLLEQLGEGGMGTVWMAEQREPIRRLVALKLIKPGMDSGQVLGRFEAERQALALMDHPNIARVLDAGATPAGRPYFVMELVKGIPITKFCDEQRLSIRERLELFMPVCQAIQHAHQKAIIHRDISPSNVLVAQYDGVPVTKVIDFGIAKAIGQQLTERTLFTGFGAVIGKLEFMSPEQAEFNQLDIDTRSDIYSLGVLLYELLTGTTPLSREALRQSALDEILRRIREEEPPKPSTRLSESKERLGSISAQRKLDPAHLMKLLRGDLDWIVMKALEKERSRRYETANALGKDLNRYLADEPIAARAPSTVHRLRKTVKRHRLAFAAGAAVLLSLLLALALSMWSLSKARTEATKSRQVAQLLKQMLSGVGPSVAMGRDTTLLREILDKTAQELEKELKDQPVAETELRSTLGDVYLELDRKAEAEAMFRRALQLNRKLFGEQHLQTAFARRKLAQALLDQGGQDRFREAEGLLQNVLAAQRASLGRQHPEVARTLELLGRLFLRASQLTSAESHVREALEMQKKVLSRPDDDIVTSLTTLGIVLRQEGKSAEAEAAYREALEIERKLVSEKHPKIAQLLNNLAVAVGEQGRFDEEESLYREALERRKLLYGEEHSAVATTIHNLGLVLERRGRLGEAEALFREALAMRRKCNGSEHSSVAQSLESIGGTLFRQGRLEEAAAMNLQAVEIRKKVQGTNHLDLAASLSNLATSFAAQTNYAEAEKVYREVLAIRQRVFGSSHPQVADSLANIAGMLSNQKRAEQAEAPMREALAILQTNSPNHWVTFEAQNRLGDILRALKRYDEAEPLLLSGYEGMRQREAKIPAYDKPRLRRALERLVKFYEATSQRDKVAEWQRKLEDYP